MKELEKKQELEEILKKIAENKEAIVQFLDVLEKLRETGVLVAIEALAEGFEEGFNAVVKPELMGAIANAMMLVWLVGNLDHEMLFSLASELPQKIEKAKREFEKAREEKPSLIKLLKTVRSPEFWALLKAGQALLSKK